MKFDREKYPALFDDDIVLKRYKHILDHTTYKKIQDIIAISKTVQTYIAKPVIDPMLTSYEKLIPHRKELKDSCRALVYCSKAGNPHVLQYVMLADEQHIQIMGQIHFIIPNSHEFGMLFNVAIDRESTSTITFKSHPSVPPLVRIELHDDVLNLALFAILSAELFINFAEIETKLMTPNAQIWDERKVNAVYNNKTRNNITVIDSTWYTNLMSSGAFTVRGHFRLQPCGPNNSKRKLTYISEFQKEGYHRKAKILEP